jgi:hypothetical protein
VDVTPDVLRLSVGDRARVAATLADPNGSVVGGRKIMWSSSDEAVVTVDPSGNVTATGVGTAQVRANSGGMAGAATVRVAAPRVATLSLAPDTVAMAPGETASLTATALDAQLRPLAGQTVTWRSSDPGVARVDQAGIVTAIGTGDATITGAVDDQRATTAITVAAPEIRAATPARDDRAEIMQAVETYRLAINSNDLNRLRDAFPDLPDEQARGWANFFDAASNLKATFTNAEFDIEGETATVTIDAQYRYRINRDETRDLEIVIHLRQAPTGWRIVAVE